MAAPDPSDLRKHLNPGNVIDGAAVVKTEIAIRQLCGFVAPILDGAD